MRLLLRQLDKRCMLIHVHLNKRDEAEAAGSHLATRRMAAHLIKEPTQQGEPGMLKDWRVVPFELVGKPVSEWRTVLALSSYVSQWFPFYLNQFGLSYLLFVMENPDWHRRLQSGPWRKQVINLGKKQGLLPRILQQSEHTDLKS